ncbi:MAG: hypothetical protein DK302_000224 [Chloroflexi bacterium]|nr:MAG: hypothetical protein DK302_000224 [Chloroflexota bacterium]
MPKLNMSMFNLELALGWYQRFVTWCRDQVDLLPPYGNYHGALLRKFVENEKYYIDLGVDRVEIDMVTFSILEDGECIKVRYTRSWKRAINIDRYTDELSFQGNE